MKSINQVVLVSVMLLVIVFITSSSTALNPVLALPPDVCFEEHCANKICVNNLADGTASCCWADSSDNKTHCQTCEVNTDIGDFENCSEPNIFSSHPIGDGGGGIISPPHSTEKCPDNTAVDKNGNCTPIIKSPDEVGDNNDNDKPNPRDNILNDLKFNQGPKLPFEAEIKLLTNKSITMP